MSEYSQLLEIKSDHENAVESFIHEILKQADESRRFGVELQVRRVDASDKDIEGFDNE